MSHPPLYSAAVFAEQAEYDNQVDGTLDVPFDNAHFVGALAALDQRAFDYMCQVLVPQVVLGHPHHQTSFLPTTMDAAYPVGVEMNSTDPHAFGATLPPDAFPSSDVAQPQGLEQHSPTAIAVNTNISQEPDYATPYFGVASPELSETVVTSTSPSSLSCPSPTTVPEGNAAPASSAQGRRRRTKGQGRHSSPTSKIPCTKCGRKFSNNFGLQRHKRTFHGQEYWYCPGLEATYATGKEACDCPDLGYSRSDVLIEHIRERGPTTPCYQGALERGWLPDANGSIKCLEGYRPQRRR